ncbi:hypothetical protein [Selenomonas sp. oral taxon 136]|uniref:hypothetical protein n=1 Tax=Selenomonas sp. oral taxon 136 TaxID=713030 RepID=UPI000AB90332|nr:hypothetical protein [Selenomonas sp. oral taxon 136]
MGGDLLLRASESPAASAAGASAASLCVSMIAFATDSVIMLSSVAKQPSAKSAKSLLR